VNYTKYIGNKSNIDFGCKITIKLEKKKMVELVGYVWPGWPGRLLFFFGCGSWFIEVEECWWAWKKPLSFLIPEEALISLDADVKLDMFSSTTKPIYTSKIR